VAKLISKETMMVGLMAIVAGLFAAWGVRTYYMKPDEVMPPPKPPAPQAIKLLVSSADLPADRLIAKGDISQLTLSQAQFRERVKSLPANYQIMTGEQQIMHRRLKKPLKQGQPFLTADFYLEGTGPSVADKLQPGYRAIRLQVLDTHEGGIQPGVFVDVFFRAKAHKAKEGQPAIPEMTVTLIEHLEVLEAERPPTKAVAKTEPPVADRKTILVTLAVPEEKAKIFSVVEGQGDLWLTPIPTKIKDGEPAKDSVKEPLKKSVKKIGHSTASTGGGNPLTLENLLGIRPPPPKPAPPPPPFETAIYRGTKMQINRFVDGKLLASQNVGREFRSLDKINRSLRTNAPEAPPEPAEPQEEE
jgi:pilus assembly protein CpaB